MQEFGRTATTAPEGALIKDCPEADFVAEVMERSKEIPVIVDFWAPWCGPCKTLGPQLEAAVTAAGGRVRMVKVNIDESRTIAAQLRIQSIPMVYAFWQGRPVDGFQGAVPQSEVAAFVNRAAGLGGDGGLAEALKAAEEMLAAGAAVEAAQGFAAILQKDENNAAAYGGLVRAHIQLGDTDQAEAILNGAPAEIADAAALDAAHAQLELARQAANAGPVTELAAAVEADPANHQARHDLAQALHANGRIEEAIEVLLELFHRDPEWNDGAARTRLLTIFEALPPQDPIALKGRRRLSSMIFA